jgi:hypothetical protein
MRLPVEGPPEHPVRPLTSFTLAERRLLIALIEAGQPTKIAASLSLTAVTVSDTHDAIAAPTA